MIPRAIPAAVGILRAQNFVHCVLKNSNGFAQGRH